MPSMFTGKKKYCGIQYKPEYDASFPGIKQKLNSKDIFLRGIDFIKSH
jgi:hypothetical protein